MVFKGLVLDGCYEIKHLNFLTPLPKESLSSYAKRMVEQIGEQKGNIALLGLSFGGIVAIEMAKHIHCKSLILVSTVKCRKELPWFIKINKYIPLYKLLPASLLKSLVLKAGKWVKVTTDKNIKRFEKILDNCEDSFYQWGTEKFINWKGCIESQQEHLHIHGTEDSVFPAEKINHVMLLKDATHFMIITRHKEISQRINHYLNTLDLPNRIINGETIEN